jgi:acetyl esterase/lipase
MVILAYCLAFLALLLGILLFIRVKAPLGFIVIFPKLAASALSPVWAALGMAGALIGGLYRAFLPMAAGVLGALIMIWYIWRVTRPHLGFRLAFGEDLQPRITPAQQAHMLKHRWSLSLGGSMQGEPRFEKDLAFTTIPGTNRRLLCDIWQPPTGVDPSGVGFIYFHGSAWSVFDKDFGTRPFFRHLAAQGHVVMDVAYRLCPEVDIFGMIGDVKRAIVWMKTHAEEYGVKPGNIVLGGASAGGHLSMLAAYAPNHPRLTPPDLLASDLMVGGVVSYYGPCDLRAVYEHTGQKRLLGNPRMATGVPGGPKTLPMQDAGRLDILLGGHPSEISEVYDLASPINHVHPGCPPTLLIQGEQDLIVPVEATCAFYRKLVELDVPSVNITFPCTEHAFDLLTPGISPVSQSAMYDVDRFLAIMA